MLTGIQSDKCKAVQHADTTICVSCNLRWDTNDPNPPGCKIKRVASASGAGEVFDELRTIALRFIERTEKAQTQSEYIIATVYVNLKHWAQDGDAKAAEMVTWLDGAIGKLNEVKAGKHDA